MPCQLFSMEVILLCFEVASVTGNIVQEERIMHSTKYQQIVKVTLPQSVKKLKRGGILQQKQ